ncbi:MAG: NDP-sugar synthase [Patescibacteria group bacterium]|jgi:mannose-1-phosphate guanylyltransferase
MIEAILLAGGKGTRLAPLTDHLPKPLVPIHGKPMMQYVLEHLQAAGITNVAISVAHLGHMIVDEFGEGSRLGMQLSYLVEPEPMGTGGWTKLVNWDDVADDFIVANADNLFWINVPAFIEHHKKYGEIATIAAIELPSADIAKYEILRPSVERKNLEAYVDRSQSELELLGKETGFISSGWYVMNKSVRDVVDDVLPISNEVHLWPRIARSGRPVGFYHATEPWFDSGTPERLARVAAHIEKMKKR